MTVWRRMDDYHRQAGPTLEPALGAVTFNILDSHLLKQLPAAYIHTGRSTEMIGLYRTMTGHTSLSVGIPAYRPRCPAAMHDLLRFISTLRSFARPNDALQLYRERDNITFSSLRIFLLFSFFSLSPEHLFIHLKILHIAYIQFY